MELLQFIQRIDVEIIKFIDGLHGPVLDFLAPILSLFGDYGIFWILCAAAFICVPKTRRMGFTMGLALLMGVILGNAVLKNLIARPRPYALEELSYLADKLLVPTPWDYSFPSGHSLASFEAAVPVFIMNKKYGIPAIVLAALISLSRIYLCVHFPSDVIAGALLGTAFALISYFIFKVLYKKFDLERRLLLPFERK